MSLKESQKAQETSLPKEAQPRKRYYDFHTFLFVKKLFNGSVKDGWCFEIQLDCKTIVQLTMFGQTEKDNQKVWCPIHQKLEEVLLWRKTRLTVEKLLIK